MWFDVGGGAPAAGGAANFCCRGDECWTSGEGALAGEVREGEDPLAAEVSPARHGSPDHTPGTLYIVLI